MDKVKAKKRKFFQNSLENKGFQFFFVAKGANRTRQARSGFFSFDRPKEKKQKEHPEAVKRNLFEGKRMQKPNAHFFVTRNGE